MWSCCLSCPRFSEMGSGEVAHYRFCDVTVSVTAREEVIADFDATYGAFRREAQGAAHVECVVRTDPRGLGEVVIGGVATKVTVDDPQSEYAGWLIFDAAAGASKTHVFLHASAVLMGGAAVLFVGPTGRGKSTLAQAMIARGAQPHNDDVTPVELASGLAERFPKGESAASGEAPRLPVRAAFFLQPYPREGRPAEPVVRSCPPHEAAAQLTANAFGRGLRASTEMVWRIASALSEAEFWELLPGDPDRTATELGKLGTCTNFNRQKSVHVPNFHVEGESMAPTLLPGDTVQIEEVTAEAPMPGDIVLLRSNEGPPALHRVMARKRKAGEWLIVTAGDGLGRLDAVLPSSRVIGRVVAVERGGRQVEFAQRQEPWRLRLRARLKLALHGRLRRGRAPT